MTVHNYYTLFLPDSTWSDARKFWEQIMHFTVQSCTFSYSFSTAIIYYSHLSCLSCFIELSNRYLLFVSFSLEQCQDFYQTSDPYQTSTFRPTIFRQYCYHNTMLFVMQVHNKSSIMNLLILEHHRIVTFPSAWDLLAQAAKGKCICTRFFLLFCHASKLFWIPFFLYHPQRQKYSSNFRYESRLG